jgi:hypothetical protein
VCSLQSFKGCTDVHRSDLGMIVSNRMASDLSSTMPDLSRTRAVDTPLVGSVWTKCEDKSVEHGKTSDRRFEDWSLAHFYTRPVCICEGRRRNRGDYR